jgi:tetratricopeptide (TPR) repeat protein
MVTARRGAAAIAVVAVIAGVAMFAVREGRRRGTPAVPAGVGSLAGPSTSRADLEQTVAAMTARLGDDPADREASVTLADALLRQSRVTGNAALAVRAEEVARAAWRLSPADASVQRVLGAVLLSRHKFAEAADEAERLAADRPHDAALQGIIGDGRVELGDYDQGFAAFDRMIALRPDATSYARVSYARELQGDVRGALDLMRMAAEATSPRDPEAQAWACSRVGYLELALGRADEAARQFRRADALFPGYPAVAIGLAKVALARGDAEEAGAIARRQFDRAPSADLAEAIGDAATRLGRTAEAERYYGIAESMWRYDTPEPALLARFLADHGRAPDEAVRIAESAVAVRHDIFTEDALAWALFRAGRTTEARAASARALRTGTRDPRIVAHAREIDRAPIARMAGGSVQ